MRQPQERRTLNLTPARPEASHPKRINHSNQILPSILLLFHRNLAIEMLLEDVLRPKKNTRSAPLLIIEHDITRSSIPILRFLIEGGVKNGNSVMVATFLHSHSVLIQQDFIEISSGDPPSVKVKDYTNREFDFVTGSQLSVNELRSDWIEVISKVPSTKTFILILDSFATMSEDLGEEPALHLIQDVVELLHKRSNSSRVVLPISSTTPAITHLLPPTVSPTLSYIRLHPPEVLIHLSKAFLLPPLSHPSSNMQKFWSIFSPFVQRERREAESLVFSQAGAQSQSSSQSQSQSSQSQTRAGNRAEETVVEVLVRSSSSRKGIERSLDGWKDSVGPCELTSLTSLHECYSSATIQASQKSNEVPASSDPTHNLPFNLSLTSEQQSARAQVPLPYAHTGTNQKSSSTSAPAPAIYYDPDSADDMDDEDPDEDLDL